MTTPDTEAAARRTVTRLRDGIWQTLDDTLVVEEPLEIRVGDERFSVTMRTPGDDFDLVRGLLLTEGLIQSETDIGRIRYCDTGDMGEGETNIVTVNLRTGLPPQRRWQRTLMSGTSCGLCGKAAIEAVGQDVTPLPDGTSGFTPATLLELPRTLRRRQELFTRTGGLHAVGLFTTDGECLCAFEDIGRHNATDKAIGYGVRAGWLPWTSDAPLALLVSGRASFEITQKALLARIPVVCAVSAASGLAADLAEAHNQTLIGFLRDTSMTIYAGAQRIPTAFSR
jgi:FdhD protein